MDSFRNCFVFDWLTARRITRQRQAMKPDRREGFMGGDGRVHPLDRRRRASASRGLASGWPERSGGIRHAFYVVAFVKSLVIGVHIEPTLAGRFSLT